MCLDYYTLSVVITGLSAPPKCDHTLSVVNDSRLPKQQKVPMSPAFQRSSVVGQKPKTPCLGLNEPDGTLSQVLVFLCISKKWLLYSIQGVWCKTELPYLPLVFTFLYYIRGSGLILWKNDQSYGQAIITGDPATMAAHRYSKVLAVATVPVLRNHQHTPHIF